MKLIISIYVTMSVIVLGILISCKDKPELKVSKFLLGFESEHVMEMSELFQMPETYWNKIDSEKFNPELDTIQFLKDSIVVSYLTTVNGCASYIGNVDIRRDTIYLKLINPSKMVCSSLRVARLRYVIKKPKDIAYTIIKW